MAMFLYIPGVRGGATEEAHLGEIELDSVQFSGGGPITGRGNQGSQFRAREITASKPRDSASNALWKVAVSGERFGFMVIDVVSGLRTSRFTLGLAMLTHMQALPDGVESFGLYFETLSFEYF